MVLFQEEIRTALCIVLGLLELHLCWTNFEHGHQWSWQCLSKNNVPWRGWTWSWCRRSRLWRGWTCYIHRHSGASSMRCGSPRNRRMDSYWNSKKMVNYYFQQTHSFVDWITSGGFYYTKCDQHSIYYWGGIMHSKRECVNMKLHNTPWCERIKDVHLWPFRLHQTHCGRTPNFSWAFN